MTEGRFSTTSIFIGQNLLMCNFYQRWFADWTQCEAHDGYGRALYRHYFRQLRHDQRRPSAVPQLASKWVWSHQGLLGREGHTARTLAECYIHLSGHWKSYSSPSDDEWSSSRQWLDTRAEEFQMMYQNFIAYPPSIVLETMSELDKIISEEIENDIRSERQVLGPCYAFERFQRALIVMQNKLWMKRVQINKELSYLIAKPLRSHSK